MDTFIDKLAQKKNAQEMIRANSAAEAVKMEQMQKQIQTYDEIMADWTTAWNAAQEACEIEVLY